MAVSKASPLRLAAVGDNCMDVYDATGACYPGGNPVNVAVYTCRLGGAASYTGVVGDDAYGAKMRRAVAEKGVDVSHLHTLPGATAVTHVTTENEDRVLGEYEEGVMADFRLTEEDITFLAGHSLVVSGLWGMVEKDLPRLKALGATLAFDFADKLEHPVIDEALPHVDYAFFSRDGGTPEKWCAFLEQMHAKGPKVTVVTLGAQGSMAYDGTHHYHQGIIDCKVVDTMGAGDSFIAGFLYGAMRGHTLADCMRQGAQSSSVTLQYHGAW